MLSLSSFRERLSAERRPGSALLDAVLAVPPPHHRNLARLVLRLAASMSLMAALLAACFQIPHVDHATVALLMLILVFGIARNWGSIESSAAAILGAIGFDYYVLPPVGFHISKPEYGVALGAFLAAAFAMIRLTERSRRLLQDRGSLLNLSLEPLCIRDRWGDFRLVNPAMVELLGTPAEELCSKPFLDFVHPDDHDRTEAAFRDLLVRPSADFENRYRVKDGSWRWMRWRIARHSNSKSEVLAVARDVTEEKWAQDKLRDLADQVMNAQEHERRRIAAELHDDVTQRLATLGIELGLLKRSIHPEDAGIHENLNRLQSRILQLAEDIRRLSHSLHPSVLEHADLAISLEMHCREFSSQQGIGVNFSARDVPKDIPRSVSIALYRIAQEGLQNVARHSRATEASVVLGGEGQSELSLFIIDNGVGFDVKNARINPGLGLVSIEERARLIGATVNLDSMPDEGTRLSIHVPLQITTTQMTTGNAK